MVEEVRKIQSATETAKAFKTILERLKNPITEEIPCKKYGCLECKHFQRTEGYDQQWGRFGFFYYKCKKQPNRNMHNYENRYDIFDIEPDYSPHFYNNKVKGECPYFEQGGNELIYMSEKEKAKCIY